MTRLTYSKEEKSDGPIVLTGALSGKPSMNLSVPMRVSALSGVVMHGGMSVVILYFPGTSAFCECAWLTVQPIRLPQTRSAKAINPLLWFFVMVISPFSFARTLADERRESNGAGPRRRP